MTDLISNLEAVLAEANTPAAKIHIMNQLAEELHYSQLNRAYDYASQAYELVIESDAHQNTLERADTLCNLGYLNLRKGEIETAVIQLFEALTIYQQHQNMAGEAKTRGKIGLTFSHIGNYTEALNHHLTQLKLSLENNLLHEEALAHNGLGLVHSYTSQYQQALTAFKKSLQISQNNNDLRQQAITLANCAYIANLTEQYQDALDYGQESLQIAEQTNNIISAGHARLEMATTYRLLQEQDKALTQLQTNLETLNLTEYAYLHAETLMAIGNLYNEWQKPEFALTYLEQALTVSSKIESIYTTHRCYKEISIAYQQNHDFKNALIHFQQFHELKEKILNKQIIANTRAIEISYQIETTQREKAFLQNQNIELEKLVAKRTAKLQKKNEELERFTYTVSHDLKSPLITIRGFLGLLERDIQRGEVTKIERNLERIDLAAERMLNLLQDLLELSKIGHTANTYIRIPLQAVILEARDLVTGHIKENNVKLTIEDNLPEVYGDYARLVEVFQNLIENSCKFMGEQPDPQIQIGAHKENDTILCFVKDNGIGIETQYQDRIFKIFERLDQSIIGTGIGLALVTRIVEYHNGRIWVESEGNGRGSTFYFTLQESFPQNPDEE